MLLKVYRDTSKQNNDTVGITYLDDNTHSIRFPASSVI